MSRAKDVTGEFICIYRESPCLWQVSSKDYHNRNKRERAYRRLLEKLKELDPSANKDMVIKKINNLRSTLRKEMKKVKSSMRTGSAPEDWYTPKWCFYELFDFLRDQGVSKTSQSNLSSDEENEIEDNLELKLENNDDGIEFVNSPSERRDTTGISSEESTSQDQNQDNTPWAPQGQTPAPPNKRKSEGQRLSADVYESVKEHFKRPHVQEDCCDIFGKYVAMTLRDVTSTQRILAQKLINDVLFEAQMGTLTTQHRCGGINSQS